MKKEFSDDLLGALQDVIRVAVHDFGDDAGREVAENIVNAIAPDLLQALTLRVLTDDLLLGSVCLMNDTAILEKAKVHAIKSIREIYGLGLKESKDLVDAAEAFGSVTISQTLSYCDKRLLREQLFGSGYKIR